MINVTVYGKTYTILPPTKDNYTSLMEVMGTDVEGLNAVINFVNEKVMPYYTQLIYKNLMRHVKYSIPMDDWDRLAFGVKIEGDNFQITVTEYEGRCVNTGSREELDALIKALSA